MDDACIGRAANEDELVDLVDIALVFAAISAAAEALGQYQAWRESRNARQSLDNMGDGRSLAAMRSLLQRIGDRSGVAQRVMDDMASKLAEALSLLEPGDPELLTEISFVKGSKARVRRGDRTRYRRLVGDVHWYLGDLLRLLDEISELVADLVPSPSRQELLERARVSDAEDRAIRRVLAALGDEETSFADAVNLAMGLLESARSYLSALTEEAFGEIEAEAHDLRFSMGPTEDEPGGPERAL
jgi:hypothetical protein